MSDSASRSLDSALIHTASSWFLRREAGELCAVDESSFQAWLDASEQHRRAYDRVRSMWRTFEDPVHGPELEALRRAALAAPSRRAKWPLVAAAVALAIVVPGMVLVLHSRGRDSAPPLAADLPAIQHIAGDAERVSTATLSDGTTVTLSFKANLDVRFTAQERRVVLTRGQAFFAVSKDPKRPFRVDAGDEQVLAVGTQFDVRLEPARVEVVLVEGSVSVRDAQNAHLALAPGQRLIAATGERPLILAADAQRLTSWRHGWITFDNESLGDAVEEFNRYSTGPLIVTDPAVESLRLGGVFRIGRPDRFAAMVQELLPVRAVSDSEGRTQLVASKTRPKIDQ